jgi:hypothetical protein
VAVDLSMQKEDCCPTIEDDRDRASVMRILHGLKCGNESPLSLFPGCYDVKDILVTSTTRIVDVLSPQDVNYAQNEEQAHMVLNGA